MHPHEIRWYVLIPVAILFCLAHLAAETAGLWFRFPSRPDWLWCLVFFAALQVPATQAVFAFAACGLVRDFLLGPRLGAATLAFIIAGWFVLHWRILATTKGVISQAAVAGAIGLMAALLKHGLDYGPLAYKLMYRLIFVSIGDAVLTTLAYIPVAALLSWKSFRPWRERGGW